jgi:hypothetical protein
MGATTSYQFFLLPGTLHETERRLNLHNIALLSGNKQRQYDAEVILPALFSSIYLTACDT